MKTKLINLLTITVIIITAVSCKGEKEKTRENSDVKEVRQTPMKALAYQVNGESSTIEWTGKKPGGQHSGTIKISSGDVAAQDGKIQSGSFVIDMLSIAVTDLEGEEKTSLEGHLKGEAKGTEDHFFNVAKFPNATFEITGIEENEGMAKISGNLTIKGITKNISFAATTKTNNNSMTLISDIFTINRTDWGVNYSSKSIFENLGDKFINDDIELKVSIVANPTS
ncbi:YceI family protein [Aquimarina sp. AU474]|uniref:YceI family protein n=1 Tax=Aquimarina sp. AU474 TaxID=2108529 RepID=UPI000D6923E8|nr:YceI family protein [Aquimarina sp. AU474]